MFTNKKIFILGMARSGYEAAKLLASKNNTILITDKEEQNPHHLEELKTLGVTFICTENPEDLLDYTYEYVIKNPGIHPEHPVCKKAKILNIPVTNELEVAYEFLPKDISIIGITGSNGKTTTTTITYNILKEANLPVHLGGNIGLPVCSLVNQVKSGNILVLEISSHQLNDMTNFKTNISVLTNLSEVHIDHFGTYENYKNQKFKIFNNHTEKDLAIINKENVDCLNLTNDIPSKKIFFSSKTKADIYLAHDSICFLDENVISINEIKIKGVHNYENIMCAVAIAKQFNVSSEVIKKVLSTFSGVEHRLEFVTEKNNIKFFNDSKATNVESTKIALSSFDSPVILLLGGLDRGHSFDELESYMANVSSIICYGETKHRIKEFADRIQKTCIVVDTLEYATIQAYNMAKSGDSILLSPACASWDQYKCFEERGDDFKRVINELM